MSTAKVTVTITKTSLIALLNAAEEARQMREMLQRFMHLDPEAGFSGDNGPASIDWSGLAYNSAAQEAKELLSWCAQPPFLAPPVKLNH